MTRIRGRRVVWPLRAIMYLTIAFHYPHPEHTDEFLAFMGRVGEAMRDTPGLLSIEGGRHDATRLIAVGRWESRAAFEAALPKLMSVPGRLPEWSARDDEVFFLEAN